MKQETLVLAGEFPAVTAAQWRAAVDRVLAGRDTGLSEEELQRRFDRQLRTTTYDGITVEPLYSGADSPAAEDLVGVPGSFPFVRGASAVGGAESGWDVRQVLDLDSGAQAPSTALLELENGATSLLVRGVVEPSIEVLDAALKGVDLELVTIALDSTLGTAGAHALLGLWKKRSIDPAAARGVLGLDPIGEAASKGVPPDAAEIGAAASIALACAQSWPQVRSWVVDATRYHEAGASDVDELACATATGVAYLRFLVDAGLELDAAFGQLEFRLAATADQFSTVAKLRAARRLWARVAEVLGVPDAGGQRQHALTSRAMLSRYEPWVNMLRSTTACFSAGVGGAEAVTVEAHDALIGAFSPTELGRRMARNTQLLLIEESHVSRVLDPGGGSWYVESLTDAMAHKAWSRLQEIEDAGGMAKALETRLVQEHIETTWAARLARLSRRSDTLVGVNDFANLDEPMPPTDPERSPRPEPVTEAGLARRRYAAPFERLRERTDDHLRAAGSRPTVLLVRLGSAAAFTARATYAKSFFETAGLRTAEFDADETTGATALLQAAADAGAALACVCSSDEVYGQQGDAVVKALAQGDLVRIYAATRPGSLGESLLGAGAHELVYAGCDVLDALTRALDVLGVP